MERRIKMMKIWLVVEVILGLAMGVMMGLFLGVMATDAPTSTQENFYAGALIGFVIAAFPVVLISALSIRELNHFPQKRSMIINLINAALVLCSALFPVAIWLFYSLNKLNRDPVPDSSDNVFL